MIDSLTAIGAFLDPALLGAWLLGSAVWTALMLAGWKVIRDVYGRDTIRYAVAFVLLWPVIYTVVAVQRAFDRRLRRPHPDENEAPHPRLRRERQPTAAPHPRLRRRRSRA